MQENYEHYLGIDLHKELAFWTLVDNEGKILKRQEVKVDIPSIEKAVKELPLKTKAIFEPVGDFLNYSQILKQGGIEVKTAIPGKVKAIAWNKLKNDRVDSEILAQLLRVNLLPSSELKTKQEYQLREIVRLRNSLVRIRSQIKQRITWIDNSLKDLSSLQIWQKRRLAGVKESLSREIDNIDKHLKDNYQNKKEIQIISSIPGCGLITALIVKSEIGDFSRFNKPEKLAAWSGLVPTSRDSGGKMRRGRITHQGSKWLRYALYEASINVRERNGNELWMFYKRIADKGNKKKARTALARKILCLIWHLIKKNEFYLKQNQLDLGKSLTPLSSKESCTID